MFPILSIFEQIVKFIFSHFSIEQIFFTEAINIEVFTQLVMQTDYTQESMKM